MNDLSHCYEMRVLNTKIDPILELSLISFIIMIGLIGKDKKFLQFENSVRAHQFFDASD